MLSLLTLTPVSYTHLDVYKRQALYESEIEEFNNFVEKLGEKAVQKGIVKNPEDIISKNGVILCERDIAILKNRKKLKECITELEQHPGYKIYNKLIERKPSEEILQEVCKSIEPVSYTHLEKIFKRVEIIVAVIKTILHQEQAVL